jgi:hypothetical protein
MSTWHWKPYASGPGTRKNALHRDTADLAGRRPDGYSPAGLSTHIQLVRNRIEAIFDAVVDGPPGERTAILDRECAGDAELRREVEALLAAHDRAEGILEADALKAVGAIVDPPKDERIGAYRVLRRLGRGGMGVVYRRNGTTDSSVAVSPSSCWPAARRSFSSTADSSRSARSSPRSTIRT